MPDYLSPVNLGEDPFNLGEELSIIIVDHTGNYTHFQRLDKSGKPMPNIEKVPSSKYKIKTIN